MLYHFKKEFGYICECSGLGERKNKYYKIYNYGYLIWGLLSLPFTYILARSIDSGILTTISEVFMYIASLSLVFIALYPRDTHLKIHTFFSFSLFISIIIYLVTFMPIFSKSDIIDFPINYLNVFVVVSLIYYSYLKLADIKRYGFDNEREIYVAVYEWIPFISGFLWIFLVSIDLLG